MLGAPTELLKAQGRTERFGIIAGSNVRSGTNYIQETQYTVHTSLLRAGLLLNPFWTL